MRLLVTAGPTREFIDPVRFISNRSSGKMGYAVAVAARDRGHEVVLISGPVAALLPPHGVRLVSVVTAADMLAAVEAHLDWSDALIMAAAVADWRPAEPAARKLKKLDRLTELRLEPTADILMTIAPRKGGRVFVGFAAETHDVPGEARRKLSRKGLDAIVANDVSRADAGFDVETNQVLLLTGEGPAQEWPLMSKAAVAERLVKWVESRRGEPAGDGIVSGEKGEAPPASARLARQMGFIQEIDRLKGVLRRTLLMDGSRYENDAEHSWHLAVMAVLLKEYANDASLNLERVIKLVLVHDLVEIDAGDTYCYDEAGHLDKAAREQAAADRIFALLPGDQAAEIRALWEEFEARVTPEARFAAALDRVQPLLHNYCTGGRIWKQHGVCSGKVRDRNRHVEEGSRELWHYAESLIRKAVDQGFLEP
jgi:putative hydrolase of HD superfamily